MGGRSAIITAPQAIPESGEPSTTWDGSLLAGGSAMPAEGGHHGPQRLLTARPGQPVHPQTYCTGWPNPELWSRSAVQLQGEARLGVHSWGPKKNQIEAIWTTCCLKWGGTAVTWHSRYLELCHSDGQSILSNAMDGLAIFHPHLFILIKLIKYLVSRECDDAVCMDFISNVTTIWEKIIEQ